MTIRSKNRERAPRRRRRLALKLALSGSVLVAAPLFLGHSPVSSALGALAPAGLFVLAIGALVLWLDGRRSHGGEARAERIAPPARPGAWSAEVFDAVEWRRFEAVMERLFQQAGFATRSQSHAADGGVDLWLYPRNSPDAPVGLVQRKHWRGRRVGVDKVRELRGVMAAHEVARGQFAVTSSFTPEAEAFARENGINLLDAPGLLGLIAKRTPEQQQALLDVALEGEYWRPTCASCGVKMIGRAARQGRRRFWGCSNCPRCEKTLPMRAI